MNTVFKPTTDFGNRDKIWVLSLVILKGTVHVRRAVVRGFPYDLNSSFQDDKGPKYLGKKLYRINSGA